MVSNLSMSTFLVIISATLFCIKEKTEWPCPRGILHDAKKLINIAQSIAKQESITPDIAAVVHADLNIHRTLICNILFPDHSPCS